MNIECPKCKRLVTIELDPTLDPAIADALAKLWLVTTCATGHKQMGNKSEGRLPYADDQT